MDEQIQKKIDELNKPKDNIPEGVEIFDPETGGVVKNINVRDDKQQFTAQDISYSSKDEKPKQERYTGPVTQASYQNNEFSQSYNSSTTTVHKSKANLYKKLFLIILVLALIAGTAYYLLGNSK